MTGHSCSQILELYVRPASRYTVSEPATAASTSSFLRRLPFMFSTLSTIFFLLRERVRIRSCLSNSNGINELLIAPPEPRIVCIFHIFMFYYNYVQSIYFSPRDFFTDSLISDMLRCLPGHAVCCNSRCPIIRSGGISYVFASLTSKLMRDSL